MNKLSISLLHITVDCLLVLATTQNHIWISVSYSVAWLALGIWAVSVWNSITPEKRKEIGRSYTPTYGTLIVLESIVVLLALAGGVHLRELVAATFIIGYLLNPFAFRILFGRLRFYAKDT